MDKQAIYLCTNGTQYQRGYTNIGPRWPNSVPILNGRDIVTKKRLEVILDT